MEILLFMISSNGMYAACKYAMTAITECLRQEVSYIEMGIRVTVSTAFATNFFVVVFFLD